MLLCCDHIELVRCKSMSCSVLAQARISVVSCLLNSAVSSCARVMPVRGGYWSTEYPLVVRIVPDKIVKPLFLMVGHTRQFLRLLVNQYQRL